MAKYNVKNIILGIGIGVIVTATFNINSLNKPLSLKELENQALDKYDKVLVSKDYFDIHKSPTPSTSATPQPTLKPTEKPTATPSVTPTLTPKPTPETTPAASPTVKPTASSPVKGFAEFRVDNYSTSESVANSLSKAGVVNKSIFLKELNRRGLTTKIKNGYYKIYKGETLKSIIYILTGK